MTEHAAPPIRVALVEDHAVVREGIRRLLDEVVDMTVVAEAATCAAARVAIAATRPDVVVLDITLPDGTGHELLASLPAPRPAVLVLTMHNDAETVARCVEAGALGFLLKGSSAADVVMAVRSVAAGEPVMDPALRGLAHSRLSSIYLTPRERAVLGLVAEGLTSAEVAEALGLAVKTVRNYRERLLAKLGVRTTAALVRVAMRNGWIH